MLNVRICVGTYCYITGGEELAKMKKNLPEDIKDKVEMIGSACLGCHDMEGVAKPPYAKVGDVLIQECTEEKLLDEIYCQLGIERE
jgi:NADH:ubiquinone oxidoreductase subunit E